MDPEQMRKDQLKHTQEINPAGLPFHYHPEHDKHGFRTQQQRPKYKHILNAIFVLFLIISLFVFGIQFAF